MAIQRTEKENLHREKLISRLEGYYGTMDQIHMLSTNDLIKFYVSLERLIDFEDQTIIHLKNTTTR